jgi:hypothetical protein
LEAGNANAELGLILKAFALLGLTSRLGETGSPALAPELSAEAANINEA